MVREQRCVIVTSIVLVVLGTLCLGLRLALAGGARPAGTERVYRLTYDIELPEREGLRASIAVPSGTEYCRVFRESFSHHGLWMDMVKSKRTRMRDVVVVPGGALDRGRFVADFDVQVSRDRRWKKRIDEESLSVSEVSHYLREEPSIQLTAPVISNTLAELKSTAASKTDLLENIYEYCLEYIISIETEGATDAATTLESGKGPSLGHIRAMIALCRAAKIPARLVCGFSLESTLDPKPHYWLEVRVKNGWRPYDPICGYRGQLPANLLPIRYDGAQIFRSTDDDAARTRFSIRRVSPDPILSGPIVQGWLGIGTLTRLPAGMQTVVTLVLLLPIGAFVTAVLRNLVGIRTYGTFTPTLIALSFIEADWRTGTVVFVVVLSVGILARLLLNQLKLLMVPRLGVLLSLVVITMVAAISLLDYLGRTPTASAVLLPLVVLTMMVERFSITAEDDSFREALEVLAGTLLAALCCLIVLRQGALSRLVLAFPEVILFVIATLMLLGRYSGYRLSELWRFRDLALGKGGSGVND